ncbi:sensor histidine kinase YesM [Paenibacillus montaniterrae]|uniref:Sensor histidine kinase YesM n=1 Tax=Paenibacillus montaniterrae TaxID=429341 RepID=A0A919YQK0_9BACL|nr:histidine kinase [Paenibacillus montaniterrae]GIP16414.1 sensor histidine kinase YesM [Paenibacillus montaniterrae]
MAIRSSIFVRLMATFFAAIIVIAALGSNMYNWSLKTVKEEIFKSTTAQTTFYLEGLEAEIDRIKILQYDVLNDEDLNKLAIRHSIMDEYETIESIRKLHHRLVSIQNSNAYISDVSAHIYPIKKTITSKKSVNALNTDKFESLRIPEGMKGAQLIMYNGNLHLTTFLMGNMGLSPLYMIEIELNTSVFREALKQFDTYPDSGSILLDMTNGLMIHSEDTPQPFVDVVQSFSNHESDIKLGKISSYRDTFVIAEKSDYLNMVLFRFIPKDVVLVPIESFSVWLWIFVGVVILLVVFIYAYTYKLIHRPMKELVKAFRSVEKGNFDVKVDANQNNEFDYLNKGFNSMVQNVSNLIDQVYKHKILEQKAELKHLQSQISPHFLYNSFFLINTMARVKDDNLIPFTKLLGEYFQFITKNDSDFISLYEEIEHARTYTDIQLMRYPSKLTIEFESSPEQFKEIIVPRLIVQPIIENAFKYAAEHSRGPIMILVYFQLTDERVTIVVEDNGTQLTDEKLMSLQRQFNQAHMSESSGLNNIHRRIQLICGDEFGLQVERSIRGGLKVMLHINARMRE